MNVFLLELRNQRRGATISTLSIAAVIFVLLAFFPSMQTQAMQELAGAKLEGVDPALLAALGLSDVLDFSVITNFFGYVLQFITLAVVVVITQRSLSLLSKEETEGTIEFLLAKPVSRRDVFAQKLLAHVLLFLGALAVYAAVTVTGYLLYSTMSFKETLSEVLTLYAAIFFVGMVFSAIGLLLSSLLTSGRPVAGVAIGIVFSTFILGIMSVVVDRLDFFIWFSPLDWIKPSKLLSTGITWGEWLTGIAVICIGIVSAWLRYQKKDLLT